MGVHIKSRFNIKKWYKDRRQGHKEKTASWVFGLVLGEVVAVVAAALL